MLKQTDRPYRICVRCVMDTSDPDIVFDEQGICNHCRRYDKLVAQRLVADETLRSERLAALVVEIRLAGKGKPYDCIIGVSGGVDSTYVAYLVKELGLRPLAVHLDNGWNSELAVSNIEKTLNSLDIDLYTHVIDWEEFRSLQVSFLKASTPDGEVPTDHAIFALLYELAAKYGLSYVITGTNVATEAILPEKWGYGYFDWRYVRAVHSRFGGTRLKSYPHLSLVRLFNYVFLRRIRLVSILNFIDYNKQEAMDVLQNKLGWIYYGGKHYESIYTRFYQAWFLPQKFGIDKRRAHYSNLVLSNQLSRQDALDDLKQPTYPDELMEEDRTYALKKLRIGDEEFRHILETPNRTFHDYPNRCGLFERAKKLVNVTRKRIG